MKVYYVETRRGCRLYEAENIQSARTEVLKKVGTDLGLLVCRKATQKDIDWVYGMGGWVPGLEGE